MLALQAELFVARSALFETTTITEEVRLLDGLTVYGRFGDLLPYLCLMSTLTAVVAVWRGQW